MSEVKIYECSKCGRRFTSLDEESMATDYDIDPEHEKCPSCYTYSKDLGEENE